VVERQHAVGLAAAERRLQLNDGIAPLGREPPDAGDEQRQQPLGEVGTAEELGRVLVFGLSRSGDDVREVRRELRLDVAPAGHVGMGLDHLAPGPQPRERRRDHALLDRDLLARPLGLGLEAHAQELTRELLDGRSLLCRAHRPEQSRRSISNAVGLVIGESTLMCPEVARLHQLRDIRARHVAQLGVEHLVPAPPHQVQAGLGIERPQQDAVVGTRRLGQPREARSPQGILHLLEVAAAVDRAVLAHHERTQAHAQRLQHPSHALTIAQCHTMSPP